MQRKVNNRTIANPSMTTSRKANAFPEDGALRNSPKAGGEIVAYKELIKTLLNWYLVRNMRTCS